ncbi:hypothetical protein [Desertivirga arenae]|uniref:hypothetical protein n=1 Tax=Desertivirga arenae TaxID=2810309 RepID=UPI001A956B09|nr:hypothetical protein [Pedobacter sp. SYSU D00823]
MISQTVNTQASERNSFNIYVDLFDKGDFYEMNVTRQLDSYRVDLDNMYLGTLSRSPDNKWEVISGTIPSALLPDITRNIMRRFEIN